MSEKKKAQKKITWTCVKCSTPLQVGESVNYFQCHTCNTMFHLHWSGGKIDRQEALENISQRMEAGFMDTDMEYNASELQIKLRTLNDSIRNVEMAKGAERIRVLAILMFISALIYLLFRFTVKGLTAFTDPGAYELAAAGVVVFSLMIILIFKIYKAAMVRKVNNLIAEREKQEVELQRMEATQDLKIRKQDTEEEVQGHADKDSARGPDIIERFASRKKSGRKRLNLREESE